MFGSEFVRLFTILCRSIQVVRNRFTGNNVVCQFFWITWVVLECSFRRWFDYGIIARYVFRIIFVCERCGFNVARQQFVLMHFLGVGEYWHYRPTVAIGCVKAPTGFLRNFRCAAHVRSDTTIIIIVLCTIFIRDLRPVLRVVVVVSRVCLRAYKLSEDCFCGGKIIDVVSGRIRAKRTGRFIRLIPTLIGISPFKRGDSSFATFFLCHL